MIVNSEHERPEKRRGKDQGPQGTQVFSRDEVDKLISEASAGEGHGRSAELTGVSASVSGQSIRLPSARVLVGRAERCDIRLDDASVSSEHARLVQDSRGWHVVNLLSTNGTFVNDEKVSNAPVGSGDRIRFGRVEFIFHDPDAGEQSGAASWKKWLPWVGLAAVAAVVVLLLW
ncbi:MAG: FHA domain-containing protein [Pseudomonadota bacterium]|nr:MAG: FHA domain-containing protein [Pseudomonadota bacterium]